MRLPCGLRGTDCSSCTLLKCSAGEYGIYGSKPKQDAMGRVSIRYDCYSDIEDKLTIEPDNPEDYVWPWPLQPVELRNYLDGLATEVCTDKQTTVVKMRHRWDVERDVGLTFKQIGKLLGIKRQSVTQQYYAALRRINKALRNDPIWEDFKADLEELFESMNGTGAGNGR